MFNRGNGRLYLGQLVTSGESTKAFTNTRGIRVNEEINDANDLMTKGTSTLTGLEKK
jgi:hypothetical protein